jgi:Ser/Thr protein kinase RdoA (MazF antagonist)
MEEVLPGGNTHASVVRVGSTVRRPTGPWTPGVHAVLAHLERAGYSGAPRVHGVDARGRKVLDFVAGPVVHPDHRRLLESDEALAEVARVIRSFHDAIMSFTAFEQFEWSDRGSDASGAAEILCHNDLAPWNLVYSTGGGWVFIDWDLAAPGRRSWDLAWALLSLVPLTPEHSLDNDRVKARLAVFAAAYGAEHLPMDVLSVAVERCEREAELIFRLAAAGEAPYDRLLGEGHGEFWRAAAGHIAARKNEWEPALSPGC